MVKDEKGRGIVGMKDHNCSIPRLQADQVSEELSDDKFVRIRP